MSKRFKVEVIVETEDDMVIFEVVHDLVTALDETDRVFHLKQIAAGEVSDE